LITAKAALAAAISANIYAVRFHINTVMYGWMLELVALPPTVLLEPDTDTLWLWVRLVSGPPVLPLAKPEAIVCVWPMLVPPVLPL
jgi:hypothetical protein